MATALSRSRDRRLAAAYATGFLGRGVAVVAPLVIVPILLRALGVENFGVWATVTSFTSMLVFADLGLGSGLLTKLSAAFGQGDHPRGRAIVSNAYFSITALSTIGLGFVLSVIAMADVAAWLGIEVSNRSSSEAIIYAVVCGFFITIPLSLITRVQLGVQQAWQSNIWAAVGPIVSIPLVWGLADRGAPPATVVVAALVAPIVVMLLNNLGFFLGSSVGRSLVPSFRLVTRGGIRELLGLGSAFAGLSILSNVALNIDNTLIAVIQGSAQVTTFALAARLFRSIALLVTIVGMPLWGANGEALARGDFAWVRRSTWRTVFGLVSVSTVLAAVLVIFREEIVTAWVGPGVDTPLALYSGFAVWSVLVAFVSPFFMVQNAVGCLRIQTIGWGAYLVLSILAKVAAISTLGANAVPWMTAGIYAVTVLPSALLGYRRVLAREPAGQRPG